MTKKREGRSRESEGGPERTDLELATQAVQAAPVSLGEANSRHLGPSKAVRLAAFGLERLAGLSQGGLSQGCPIQALRGPQRAWWGPGPLLEGLLPLCLWSPSCKTPHSAECPASVPLPFQKTVRSQWRFYMQGICFRIGGVFLWLLRVKTKEAQKLGRGYGRTGRALYGLPSRES